MVVQTLSNIITNNDALLNQFWSALVGMEESKNILMLVSFSCNPHSSADMF